MISMQEMLERADSLRSEGRGFRAQAADREDDVAKKVAFQFTSDQYASKQRQDVRNLRNDAERTDRKADRVEEKAFKKLFGEDAALAMRIVGYIQARMSSREFADPIKQMLFNANGAGDALIRDHDTNTVGWGVGMPDPPDTGVYVLVSRDGVASWEAAEDVTCPV